MDAGERTAKADKPEGEFDLTPDVAELLRGWEAGKPLPGASYRRLGPPGQGDPTKGGERPRGL